MCNFSALVHMFLVFMHLFRDGTYCTIILRCDCIEAYGDRNGILQDTDFIPHTSCFHLWTPSCRNSIYPCLLAQFAGHLGSSQAALGSDFTRYQSVEVYTRFPRNHL
jgi:hypothetical protein